MEISHVATKEEKNPGLGPRAERVMETRSRGWQYLRLWRSLPWGQEWKWKRSLYSCDLPDCGLTGYKHSVGRECIRYADFEVLDPPASWQADPGCLDKIRTKSEYGHILFCFNTYPSFLKQASPFSNSFLI